MKAAALLGLLAALPAHAGDVVTPAQARANVVQALPPDIAKGAGSGDLRAYLERLSPEQKAAALRSLTEKEGELGGDPTTLGVIGQAYAGLGKVQEARDAAQTILNLRPNDPEARRLMAWVTTREKLAGRGTSPAAFGDTGGPSGGQAGSAASRPTGWNGRVQRLMGQRGRSKELDSVVRDASKDAPRREITMEDLTRAGIAVVQAPDNQERAVQLSEKDGRFTVSIREDALYSTEARAAAHLGNGLRQAATDRDESGVAWAYVVAKGWLTGGRIHKELAPQDVEARPRAGPDADAMTMRRILDLAERRYDSTTENLGTKFAGMMTMLNNYASNAPQALYERFVRSTHLDKDKPANRN